ncbi:DUF4142 domain-containing protein [Piscinibacter gummiphilus]|uniref:DUF4142 domain-containing protein n=1 Tax=Piscinibacter gummiphilus TaxID=946333 RepID=A0ABZ0D500_9BURK|nr:DUF4142 domain-containing protein [Piscinibacter gummiphilus]WOB10123.1 DUF4142 domain-containing protein [Piscinibacter gummiphilus]
MIKISRMAVCAGMAALGLMAATAASARSDADFMKQAAQNGAAEIEASKLALQKAQRSDVKAFAEKMVADHTKTSDELKQLAAAKKVSLPDGPSMKQKGELKMISAGDDAKFDERYAKNFGVKAHEETIKLFEEAAKSATDAEVKAFAQKTLPGLNHHLEMARALESGARK